MTTCSENMLLLYRPFITWTIWNSGDVMYLRWWYDLDEIRFAERDEMSCVITAYTSCDAICVYVFLLFEIEWPVDISGLCEWNRFGMCYARIPRHTNYEYIVKTENRSIQFSCDFHVWNWMRADFHRFWCVSSLMTICSEIILLLYGPFITRTRCACEDGIWIRW